MCRLDLPDHHIRVGDRQGSATPIACRARVCPGTVGSHPEAATVEMQDRASTGGDGVDRHHRSANLHACDLGVEGSLELSRIQRHVGRRPTHVEADHSVETRCRSCANRANHSSRRPRKDGVFSLKASGVREAAVRLHEIQWNGAKLGDHPIDITAQNWREVGIDSRRLAARDEPDQRTHLMADRHLPESRCPCEVCQPGLALWMLPGVDQSDGDGLEALGLPAHQHLAHSIFIHWSEGETIAPHSAADLFHRRIERLGFPNRKIEQSGSGLRTDTQQVRETAIHEQERPGALSLQERVGRDGGSHLDRRDRIAGNRRIERKTEGGTDPGDGGVSILFWVVAQQFDGRKMTAGVAGDDVSERAPAVDPELPTAGCRGGRGCHFF